MPLFEYVWTTFNAICERTNKRNGNYNQKMAICDKLRPLLWLVIIITFCVQPSCIFSPGRWHKETPCRVMIFFFLYFSLSRFIIHYSYIILYYKNSIIAYNGTLRKERSYYMRYIQHIHIYLPIPCSSSMGGQIIFI